MQIEYNGKKIEAYSLTLYKKHAQEILSGKKTIEIRNLSDKNWAMFIDKEAGKKWHEAVEANKSDEELDALANEIGKPYPFLNEVFAIHFYDRGGRYELNVLLDEVGFACMNKEDIEFLAKEFGFHDYDNEWQKYKGVDDVDKPHFFWFHIDKIVSSRGLD